MLLKLMALPCGEVRVDGASSTAALGAASRPSRGPVGTQTIMHALEGARLAIAPKGLVDVVLRRKLARQHATGAAGAHRLAQASTSARRSTSGGLPCPLCRSNRPLTNSHSVSVGELG